MRPQEKIRKPSLADAIAKSLALGDVAESQCAMGVVYRAIRDADRCRHAAARKGQAAKARSWARKLAALRCLGDIVYAAECEAIRIDRDADFAAASRAKLQQGPT